MKDKIKAAINWILRPLKLGVSDVSFTPNTRVDDSDSSQFSSYRAGPGPADVYYPDFRQLAVDSLVAWRQSFMVRQIVRLMTAYVVGDRIEVGSPIPEVNEFLKQFWVHGDHAIGTGTGGNQMDRRLPSWCDELTRVGEIYPVLFTNKVSGMSTVRQVPASEIVKILTKPSDYETETGYLEAVDGELEPKKWKSRHTAKVHKLPRKPDPMMLHYRVNPVVGATRGEGDLGPVLPWALRYSQWLKGRAQFNDIRTKAAVVEIELQNDVDVPRKQAQYAANPPTGGSVFVHGPSEKIRFPSAQIQSFDAQADGQAFRLAVAAGGNVPLHFLGEGSSATRSTATEMGDPTHRAYRKRQNEFVEIVVDICTVAWRRFEQVHGLEPLKDLGITAEAPDISRADNKAMADSAKAIVETFQMMKAQGWVTDEIAVRLAFKFAGEILTEDEIRSILGESGSESLSSFSIPAEMFQFIEGLGLAEDLKLPQQPRDGQTVCGENCNCTLRFVERKWRWLVYWDLDTENTDHCDDCLAMNKSWNPLRIRKKDLKIISSEENGKG